MFTLALYTLLGLVVPAPVFSDILTEIKINADVDPGTQYALSDIISAYLLVEPNISMSIHMQSIVASTVLDIEAGAVDFGTTSAGLSDTDATLYPNLQMYPILCSALVPVYRLDALGTGPSKLVLSRSALAAIYLGEITWWNDTRLQVINSVVLPRQRIVVMLSAAGTGRNLIWTTALGNFYPLFNSTIPASLSPSWPYAAYYQWQILSGTTGLATAVFATDGSIGYTYQSIALQMQNDIAAMINQAGNTVQATSASITFATVELGTQPRSRATAFVDITDATGSSAWPITAMSSVLIDTQYSPTICHVRAAVVQFWLWYYSSSVVTSILASRQYAPIPSIVLSEFNVMEDLQTQVSCRGTVALPITTTQTRIMGTPSMTFVNGLLADLYQGVDSSVLWTVENNSDEVTLQQLVNAEIDIAFINPDNVDANLLNAVVASPDFLLFPTYLIGPSFVYNPQITANVSIAGFQVTMTLSTIGLLMFGCITAWNDPRILAENPWLAPLLPLYAAQPVPIILVASCGQTVQQAPVTFALLGIVDAYLAATQDLPLIQCMETFIETQETAFENCEKAPTANLRYVAVESAIPPLVLGVAGSVGFMLANGDTSYGIIQLADYRDGSLEQHYCQRRFYVRLRLCRYVRRQLFCDRYAIESESRQRGSTCAIVQLSNWLRF